MQVRFSQASNKSLTAIYDYIAVDNVFNAEIFVIELYAKAISIGQNPKAYPYYDLVRNIRKKSYKGYIIFYKASPSGIFIINIINSRQNYVKLI